MDSGTDPFAKRQLLLEIRVWWMRMQNSQTGPGVAARLKVNRSKAPMFCLRPGLKSCLRIPHKSRRPSPYQIISRKNVHEHTGGVGIFCTAHVIWPGSGTTRHPRFDMSDSTTRRARFTSCNVTRILGRFRKHNATPNRDVTCLGMAWARLPVNREIAGAWSSRPKIVIFWRTKRSTFLLRAFNAIFSPISPQAACSAQPSSVNDDVSRRDLASRCVF